MKRIPIFDLKFDADFRRKFHDGCEVIFNEGYLTNHTMVRLAEEEFSRRNSSAFSLALSTGTSALEVALKSINVQDREVVLPSNTFVATFLAVRRAGGIPVIVDVEKKYYSLCPEKLGEKINPKTKAVITVHVGGYISPTVKEIKALCQKYGVYLVEDAAHAHFSEIDGMKAGNIGDIGCFSFHMTKAVTAGEGGMMTTRDKDLFERASSLRHFGMDLSNKHSHIQEGSNYKLGEFNALMMRLDLERSEERISKRRLLAKRYQGRLQGTSWTCLEEAPGTRASFYKQIIVPPPSLTRDEIQKKLQAAGIALTNGVYYLPLHKQPICQDFLGEESFEVSEEFAARHICPPCHPELGPEDIDRVCDELLTLSGER